MFISVFLAVQSALARRLCTSRWLPDPTLWDSPWPTFLLSSVWQQECQRGDAGFAFGLYKCFYVRTGLLNRIGGVVECSRATACGMSALAILY